MWAVFGELLGVAVVAVVIEVESEVQYIVDDAKPLLAVNDGGIAEAKMSVPLLLTKGGLAEQPTSPVMGDKAPLAPVDGGGWPELMQLL